MLGCKFSPVAPPEFLLLLKEQDLLGDYLLILAHDVVRRPDLYEMLFDNYSGTIIMDNSVIELGVPVSTTTMVRACEIVPPTYVVLPDHLRKLASTIVDTLDTLHKWRDAGLSSFMMVPQGDTPEEFRACVDVFALQSDLALWGVPKIAADVFGWRASLIQYIALSDDRPIHLLGFTDSMTSDIVCGQAKGVIGIDSAVPIRYGIEGMILDDRVGHNIPRPVSFWEDAVNMKSIPEAVITNIENVRKWFS